MCHDIGIAVKFKTFAKPTMVDQLRRQLKQTVTLKLELHVYILLSWKST